MVFRTIIVSVCIISVLTSTEVELDGKIVGGVITSIEQFPFQVSIRYDDRHMCGGSIVDRNFIVTACHCVTGYNHSHYSVRVGSTIHNLGKIIRVSEVIEHEDFNTDILYDNDVALLKLATPLKFNKRITPVELQPKGVEVPAGTVGTVTGWGITEEGDIKTPLILRKVEVATITTEECTEKYDTFTISDRMLCAQTPNHDSCQGDSGGPLSVDGKLIGIVSWGFGCARPEYPGVYTKVSEMYDWIASHL